MLTERDFTPHEAVGLTWPSIGSPPWTVAAIGLLTLLVVLTNCWVVREMIRSAESRDTQWQSFHRQVIGDLQELTHAAGLTTSHELSPVRFRFRRESTSLPPTWEEGTVRLSSVDQPAFSPRIGYVGSMCDFGLVPPGRYRLDVVLDFYDLEWDFDVFPGAPVDRLVMYPLNPPIEILKLELKASAREQCRGGICIVKALPVVRGNWTWHHHDSVVAVIDHRMSDDEAARLIEHAPGLQQRLSSEAIPVLNRVPFMASEVCTAYLMSDRENSVTMDTTIHFGDSDVVRKRNSDTSGRPNERFHTDRPQLHWIRNHPALPLIVNIPEGDRSESGAATHAAITPGISAGSTERQRLVSEPDNSMSVGLAIHP